MEPKRVVRYTIVRQGMTYQVREDLPGGGTAPAFHGLQFASQHAARQAILAALGGPEVRP